MSNSRRAQTAIEGLLLMSIVVLSSVIVILPYLENSREATILLRLKDSASFSASYITNGVVIGEEKFDPLNSVIKNYTGSSGVKFSFLGLKIVRENSSEIVVLLKFSHNLNLTKDKNSKIAKLIGEFVEDSLKDLSIISTYNGKMYSGEKHLILNITVEDGWSVIK
ncbi:hypothetical protein [Pyrococcus kukulkanii]|uniref:hypothetical protein n=1 Tax=Pyrococcus kukulkanii TaxID=1609559 RepID=UPI00356425B3